tara:strand:- start:194 stop:526 length:333 start_codon:yes stop_codon:yes gene_type:complete
MILYIPSEEEINQFFDFIFNDYEAQFSFKYNEYNSIINYFLNNENNIMTNSFSSYKDKKDVNFNIDLLIESKKFAFEKDYIYENGIKIDSPNQRPIQFKFCLNLWLYIHH